MGVKPCGLTREVDHAPQQPRMLIQYERRECLKKKSKAPGPGPCGLIAAQHVHRLSGAAGSHGPRWLCRPATLLLGSGASIGHMARVRLLVVRPP
jgi:hypothetical protein